MRLAWLLVAPLAGFGVLALLAVVQGLTEFLPVSSSGHLVLCQELLEIEDAGILVEVALHVGTLLAVLAVYGADAWRVLRDLLAGDARELMLVVIGTLPVVIVGFAFEDAIEEHFQNPDGAAVGLIATALILGLGDRGGRRALSQGRARQELDPRRALAIGCAQSLAVLPGISRSGATISTALLLGVAPDRAARFSFLLSIPAILGAALLMLPDARDELAAGEVQLLPLLLASLLAGVLGWVALRTVLRLLDRGHFVWFAPYCALLGIGWLLIA